MIFDIVWLVAGLAAILVGADMLTDGSSAIAKRMGVSDLIIGLTVVAFGTSTPELVISVMSAVNGNDSLAVGNIVGSNILNILLILGITALIRPIIIKKSVMTNEIPMVVLSSLIMLVFGYSATLDGGPEDIITRVNGIMLLIFFILFMRYTFASARRKPAGSEKDPASADGEHLKKVTTLKATVFIIIGLAGLIWGGDRFVDAVKNQPGLAVGNVIGSNIFNILFVLGTAATVAPLPFRGVTRVDLWTLMGASIMFLVFARAFRHRCITRPEGIVMLVSYIAYMVWLVIAQ